ncbi:MAG: serine/threonine protein kinase [Thermoflexibacter sp.]|jgi:serine/threonine protein kinase|nr:serine/threonine protein kinase [Thermoflexibacter sp.]
MEFNERYENVEELHSEGNSYVYKAFDRLKDDFYVIKVVPPNFNLIEEIKIGEKLKHDNIVIYHDIQSVPNPLFGNKECHAIIMEYVEGGNLASLYKSRQLTLLEIKHILLGILDGLSYLHLHNSKVIVHRDLKPHNILIDTKNEKISPKICDFGISKNIENDTSLTVGKGTEKYAAPEQFIENSNCTIAVDIWSLGIIIYELFLQKLPFQDKEEIKNKTELVDIDKVIEPYQTIIKKCLNKEPEQRYSSVAEVRVIIQNIKEEGNDSLLDEKNIITDKEIVSKVLFLDYDPSCEPFYIQRQHDNIFCKNLKFKNIWVSGSSGLGKTATIKRNLIFNNYDFHYCYLGSVTDIGVESLLNSISSDLKETFSQQLANKSYQSDDKIIEISKILYNIFRDKTFVIYIDEIPISEKSIFIQFVVKVNALVGYYQTLSGSNKNLCIVVSTIDNPKQFCVNLSKANQYIHFIDINFWSDEELGKLLDIILSNINMNLSYQQKQLIIDKSSGSPRFIKGIILKYIMFYPDYTIEEAVEEFITEQI